MSEFNTDTKIFDANFNIKFAVTQTEFELIRNRNSLIDDVAEQYAKEFEKQFKERLQEFYKRWQEEIDSQKATQEIEDVFNSYTGKASNYGLST